MTKVFVIPRIASMYSISFVSIKNSRRGDKGQVSKNKTCLISLLPSGSIFYKLRKMVQLE